MHKGDSTAATAHMDAIKKQEEFNNYFITPGLDKGEVLGMVSVRMDRLIWFFLKNCFSVIS